MNVDESNEVERILARAKRHEQTATAAEDLRRDIRLRGTGRWVVTKRIVLRSMDRDMPIPTDQMEALYEALGIVRANNESAARQLREQVGVKS